MAAVDIAPAMDIPLMAPPPLPVIPQVEDPKMQRILNRKRRMNFFDLANLLDSDGNLQNEMMVFAFAATMMSTIPILLGNEFDVNVGLRRKRRQTYQDPDLDTEESSSYLTYASHPDEISEPFFSASTYKKLMTAPPGTKDFSYIYNGSATMAPDGLFDAKEKVAPPQRHAGEESAVANASMMELLRELLVWSHEKTKDKPLLPMLINLALDKYAGNPNPADKFVRIAYKKWNNLW